MVKESTTCTDNKLLEGLRGTNFSEGSFRPTNLREKNKHWKKFNFKDNLTIIITQESHRGYDKEVNK